MEYFMIQCERCYDPISPFVSKTRVEGKICDICKNKRKIKKKHANFTLEPLSPLGEPD